MILLFLVGLVAATVAVLRCRLEVAAGVLMGVLFLVPGNLVLTPFHSITPVFRIVLWAYAVGLVLRVARGEVDLGAFRPTRVQWALALFVGVALVNGVALSKVDNPSLDALLIWMGLLDQLVVLTVVVVTGRAIGVWRLTTIVAGFAVAMGTIAAWEHFSEVSYARWWYQQAGRTGVKVAAEPLTPRGDAVRVRGPYQFALEFSWVAVMVLPVVMVVATRARRRLALAGPAVLALALLWSWSRSSLAGAALAAGVLVLASRFDRRAVAALGAAAAIGVVMYLAVPGIRGPFDAADEDSAASRTRRLALITEGVVDDPYTGLGLAGLRARSVGGADASFTLIYAALGVPGVLTLAVAQGTALASCAAGVRRARSRPVAAAALAGVAGGVLGNFALDLVAVPGSGKTFWIVAGLGTAASVGVAARGPVPVPAPIHAVSRARWAVVALAGVVGFAVSLSWPTHFATDLRFQTIERPELGGTDADVAFGGRFLVNTACDLVDLAVARAPGGKVECIESRVAPGVGSLRIESRDQATTEAIAAHVEATVQGRLPGFTLHAIRADRGRPTPVRTLPFWLTGLAAAGAVLAPATRRRAGGGDDPSPAVQGTAGPEANVTGWTWASTQQEPTVGRRSRS